MKYIKIEKNASASVMIPCRVYYIKLEHITLCILLKSLPLGGSSGSILL